MADVIGFESYQKREQKIRRLEMIHQASRDLVNKLKRHIACEKELMKLMLLLDGFDRLTTEKPEPPDVA